MYTFSEWKFAYHLDLPQQRYFSLHFIHFLFCLVFMKNKGIFACVPLCKIKT